jgi:signal transduction histidine kinase
VKSLGAASERFESLLRRVFTVALLAISFEIVANFYFQYQFLQPVPALTAISLLLVSQLALVASAWFGHGRSLWFGAHSLLALFILMLWPSQVEDAAALGQDFKPWVWWALGIASLSAAIAWRNAFSWLYIAINPIVWLFISLHPSSGPVLLADSLRDSSYLLLFPLVLAALLATLRSWIAGVDEANAEAIASAIARARVDASERERQRLDALVHDQVLHALLSAAAAETETEQRAAAALATESIGKLEQIDDETDPLATVSANGLFRALRKAALRLNPEVRVSLSASEPLAIGSAPAEALTAATIQALENALQHAEAADITLDMRASKQLVEVSVRDNGKGFLIDRVPRNRLGLQTSIIQRVNAIGGDAEIISKPGSGTSVTLRWSVK